LPRGCSPAHFIDAVVPLRRRALGQLIHAAIRPARQPVSAPVDEKTATKLCVYGSPGSADDFGI